MNQELFLRALRALDYLRPGSEETFRGDRFLRLAEQEPDITEERSYLNSFQVERSYRDSSIAWMSLLSSKGHRLIFMGPSLDISTRVDVRIAKPSEFLFFCDFFEVYPSRDATAIMETLGSGSRLNEDYQGHDHAQFSDIFNQLYVIEGADGRQLCISSIITKLYIELNQSHSGNFDIEFFQKIKASEWFSCDFEQAKLLSVFQISGPLHFLVLYWLVEGFFFEFSAKSFYNEIGSSISEEDFYQKMESKLDWRPKEIFAFERIIAHTLEESEIHDICASIENETFVSGIDSENRAEFLAKKLYSFRNSLVHSRHKRTPVSVADVNRFSCAVFDIVNAIFKQKDPSGQKACKCGLAPYFIKK